MRVLSVSAGRMRGAIRQQDGSESYTLEWETAEEASTPKNDDDKKTLDCGEMG